ncbi:MAG TPA: hypothetical protein VJ486_02770 [Geothrix sp.]|nr:hypothetical protein [Geothrix sp.]
MASRSGSRGFDPHYGARPLKRLIQQAVINPLARLILKGQFHPGDRVWLEVKEGQLSVKSEAIQ